MSVDLLFENSMPPIRRNARDTNYLAAQKLFPKTGQYKHRLVSAHIMAGADGLTDHEAASALGQRVPWSTAGATRISLNNRRDHGVTWFEETTVRRPNENGNPCTVWVLHSDARELLELDW